MNAAFHEMIRITGVSSCFPSNAKNFKQLQVQTILDIPDAKPDMEHILHDYVDVEINEALVVDTPCTVSNEGQVLTGRKLIVNGRLLHKIEYTADNSSQSVHAAEVSAYFSTFIMLNTNSVRSYTFKINHYIEDVLLKQLDSRKIFQNVLLLLEAVPVDEELFLSHHEEDFHTSFCKRYFTQICMDETITLSHQKPDIEQVISVIVEPEIVSFRLINTIKGISNEGQYLTGKKAVIEMKLKQKTLYAADMPDQSVYASESTFYKVAYIILPQSIEGTDPEMLYKCNMLKPTITIENIYYTKLDKRVIYKNLCMLIELELIPTFEICYSSYNDCTSSLSICYGDGSFAMQITQGKDSKNIKPCWSPNGSQIAYLTQVQKGFTLYSFNIKTCSHKALISQDDFDNISSFSWLKNSQQLIFSGTKGKCKELYLKDAMNEKYHQITQGDGMIKSYYPKISPKGDFVAYLRSSTSLINLWYSDLAGKNPSCLTSTRAVIDYDWLANDEGIVYIDSNNDDCCEIYLIKLGSSHASCIVKSNSLFGCKALAVSPDGRFIAFVGTNKYSDDIYLFNRATTKVLNVTKHQNPVKISSIEWNTDSNKIYYSAREFVYYNLFELDISDQSKKKLTNTSAACIQLSYRPKIK